MKNEELLKHVFGALEQAFYVGSYAEIKQSDVAAVLAYLRTQAGMLEIPKDRVVHWDTATLELLTSQVVELTRYTMLIGKEVNRMRHGQRKPMKDFLKEAQRSDEMLELQKKRKEEHDVIEG